MDDAETVRVGGRVLESTRFNAPFALPASHPALAPARRPQLPSQSFVTLITSPPLFPCLTSGTAASPMISRCV